MSEALLAMGTGQNIMETLTGASTAVVSMIWTSSRVMVDTFLAEATNCTPVFRSRVVLLTDTNALDKASMAVQPAAGMSLSEILESVKNTSLKSSALMTTPILFMLRTVTPTIVADPIRSNTIACKQKYEMG
jgi:hypothetical protein